MRIAAAAHLAQRLRGEPPREAVTWLSRTDPYEAFFPVDLRLQRITGRRMSVKHMAFGAWNHATAHLHAAFTAELLIPPFGPLPDRTRSLIPGYPLNDPAALQAWLRGYGSA
ncbi:hypothetical protein E4N62_12665 [Streptomyces sp. MNU76]|uniref:hypothetical protein n=1 Tax=Streptomyces sp. MNU76 TaxID=2560026 RepID=UPI001E31EF8A|nr:hypothetical protein [Streptomyces sp. MNU76]MCC9706035.1 hypothetical protein [Streptomyces sp. MNU76]